MKVSQLPIGTEFGIYLSPDNAKVPRVKRLRLLKKGPASALVVVVGDAARRTFEVAVGEEGEKKTVTFAGASGAYHISSLTEAEVIYD